MARCNCAPCLVCGNGKCDCDCVGGGPYLTREAADCAAAKQSAIEIERECREAWKQVAYWRERAEGPGSLSAWLRWVAGQLETRDKMGGTFAPGVASSLRGRAYVLELVETKAALQGTGSGSADNG